MQVANKVLNIDDSIREDGTQVVVVNKNLENKITNISSDMYALAQQYVKGNIQPEYHTRVLAQVNDTINSALRNNESQYDEKKSIKAYDKLIEDYRKYHYFSNPELFLEEYLYMNAKDGRFAKIDENDKYDNEDEKINSLIQESNTMDSTLNALVSHAALIEMQELLVDAVKSGNPAEIKNIFAEQTFENEVDGNTYSLMSDYSVDYMVKTLIVGNNIDTAVMFVDKLGLAENFIKVQNSLYNQEYFKSKIDELVDTSMTAMDQVNAMQDAISKFDNNFASDDNYERRIDQIKQEYISKTKDLEGRKKYNEMFCTVFDGIKDAIAANPELQKDVIAQKALGIILQNNIDDAKADVAALQQNMNAYSITHNFINALTIPEYSVAYKEKEKFDKDYYEVRKYNNDMLIKLGNENPFISINLRPDK